MFPKNVSPVNRTDVDVMLRTVVHPVPLDHPVRWVEMESPAMMDPQASKANLANLLLHQLDPSHHADHAPAVPRDHLDHPVPPAHRVPPAVPDQGEAMETPAAVVEMALEAHPDPRELPAVPDRTDHPEVLVFVESRDHPDPRDHPATEDHPDPLADPAPTDFPDPRATLAPVATPEPLATTEPPVSPEPPAPPDHPERMPNTVLALLVVLAARARRAKDLGRS